MNFVNTYIDIKNEKKMKTIEDIYKENIYCGKNMEDVDFI